PVAEASSPEAPAAAAPEAPPPAPEVAVASEPSESLLDRLLGNAMVLAGAVGVALIAMLAFLFTRRRRDSDMPVPAHELRKVAAQAAAATAPKAATEPDLDRDDVQEKALFGAPGRVKAVAAGDQEIADPVSEADIYIAYGKPQTAIELLGKALVQHPERTDVRLKLMDIHAEQGNVREFIAEFDRLEALGDPAALRAARELLEDTDRAHWLLEIDGQNAVEAAAGEEPDLVTAELDFASPQLDAAPRQLDGEDLTLADEAELSLELELGELEPGVEESAVDSLGVSAAELAPASAAGDLDDELDLLEESDEVETKLELARAYMDMGDMDGARDILEEVVAEGAQSQRDQASLILETLRAG
ncbi:MAG: hypothetical protein KBG75_14950, partial [Pseudomonadales bacterium]|nr:hypothetical protein [Pseudomonadales bacterium]